MSSPDRPAPVNPLLPRDSVLLPLSSGQLLVSREYALFCRVPPDEVPAIRETLADGDDGLPLSAALRADLARHGFGGPPRPAAPETPSVQLQLTNECNLACAYCCTNSGRPRASEIDEARARTVVAEVRQALGAGTRVALLGGEPLLVPWATDLGGLVIDLGLSLTLFTNGVPLTDPALAGRVAGLTRRGAEVRVSLAGPTAATCDGVSRATRFDVAVRGVNQLLGLGGSAIVDLMLVPQHADEVVARFGELRSRFPRGTKITLGLLYVSGRETGEHMFESRSRLEELLDRVAFEAGEAIAAPRRSPLADRREACTCALGHHLHVRSDGALFTCFKMEEQVGHLGQTGFSRTVEMVRAAPRPARSLRFCAGCPLATLCGGGCRAENLQYTGDADVPVCGPWRLRVLSELLAEDRVTALEWPAVHLLTEARERGIDGPSRLVPALPSRHLLDT